MECSNCGATAKVIAGTYPFRESGLNNVVLCGIDLVKCPACHNVDPIIPHVNQLMRVLALAVISHPFRLRGEDVRFLRKFIGKNGREFAELLHVDPTTLSKWENNEDPVGPNNDRLIRAVVLGLGDGLKEQMEDIIHMFPQIEDTTHEQEIEIDSQNMSYQYA